MEVITEILSSAGCTVSAAISGERALKRLALHVPDLILLDLKMPGMDGFETCQHIKANSKTANIPVIFITARSDIESVVKGFSLGAVDYISKPFQESELLVRVKTHLQLRHVNQLYELEKEKNDQLDQLNHQLLLTQYSVDHAAEGILWIDQNQHFFKGNQAICNILGYSAEELLKLSLFDIEAQLSHEQIQVSCLEIKEQGSLTFESLYKSKSGHIYPVEVSTKFLEFEGQEYYLSRVRDISDRKQKEQALEVAQQAAEAAYHAKSEFLANMSHELRTPLNAVLGFTQLMQYDTSTSKDHQENLAIINRNGEHLLTLINNILEASKMEVGYADLELCQINLFTFLDEIKQQSQPKADAKQLQLTFNYSPQLPQYILVDSGKLRQILLSLLDNAIKFTQAGQISLTTSLQSTTDINNTFGLRFTVTDTGSGIEREEIEQVFQMFVQASLGKQSGQGSGLGLAISRKFARLMGGDITLESFPGKGCIFYCDILVKSLA
ncbi:MAG: response regulator [Leptolyngbya sp. SIO1D8]|nr:response regulator [Leptolyngbya sp. SIO1D8]